MSTCENMSKRSGTSKRRSTFGRRRSRSLGALATNEICKTIDKNLLPADRLQLLTQHAIETAFSKAREDITDDVDDYEVSKLIKAAQVEIESEIEAQSLYSLAVSKDDNMEGGVSEHVKIAQYKSVMAKLEEEQRQWDAAVAKEREELEKEINLRQIEFKDPLDREKLNLYDYSNLLEDISFIDSSISYQVSRLQADRLKIKRNFELVEASLAAMTARIESHFDTITKECPKSLIKDTVSEKLKET